MARLTIGLPVYNGEEYLALAIDSILGQTFRDFKLLIADNASTDSTPDICRAYAEKDSRVDYHRNEANVGAAPNFNMTFERCTSEYFKWAAHDDLLAPEFLEECIAVLDEDPAAVLCHSDVECIDPDGEKIANFEARLPPTDLERPSERFRELIGIGHWCIDVFGVIRRDVLARTQLIGSYVGSDRNLLAELGLRGHLRRVPRVLFYSRDHSDRSIRALPARERAEWFNTAETKQKGIHYLRRLREYHRSVHRVTLPFGERVRCYRALARWVWNTKPRLLEEIPLLLRRAT